VPGRWSDVNARLPDADGSKVKRLVARPRARIRLAVPFTLVALLPLLLAPFPPGGGLGLMAAYTVLTMAVFVSIVAFPWERVPEDALAVPGVVYCVAVACARQAEGGARSGFGLLYMLPIMFLALYGNRRTLYVVAVATVVASAVPIIVMGAPDYPLGEWRRTVIWTAVAPMVGIVVQDLVLRLRQHQEAIARVTTAARSIAYEGDNREGICHADLDLAGADLAMLVEPRPGALVSTAGAGIQVPPVRIQLGEEPSAVEIAYRSEEPFFLPDVESHPATSKRLVSGTALASAYYQPVMRGEEVVGVLVVGWRITRARVRRSVTEALALLAAEAAVAMERADRFSSVASLAASDPLTGLPNRRRWDEEAARMVARAERTGEPLTIALMDLDRFKAYNDARGHQTGDRLLKEASAVWRDQLRAGDLLARWGGEEFAVALPGATAEQAVPVLERLRRATPSGQTASVGVAAFVPGAGLAELVEQADQALYRAKSNGRDCLELVAL
jgi:diguanylate cyclase (GGDEF)-like protein